MLLHKRIIGDAEKPVKFVSYTGKWPKLCVGTLTLRIDGRNYSFGCEDGCDFKEFWSSGGGLSRNFTPYSGEWKIDVAEIPEEFRKYAYEIDRVFNDNVAWGCCGGCS